jgi:hypothetical protein
MVTENLSRRETARKRRTEHEKAYKSVENPWSRFYGVSPDLAPQIGCRSSVVEHLIGNEEVGGSIPPGSTTSTSRRGDLSEIMVMAKLIQLGASV